MLQNLLVTLLVFKAGWGQSAILVVASQPSGVAWIGKIGPSQPGKTDTCTPDKKEAR